MTARRSIALLAGLALVGCALVVLFAQLPVFTWLAYGVQRLEEAGPIGIAVFMLVHLLAIVGFVPASPFVFAAGMVWGTAAGTLIITIGNAVGPALAFIAARSWVRPTVHKLVQGNRHAAAIEHAMRLGGFRAVILLRLSPIVPMAILNYGLGLFPLPLRTYTVATALGLLPITVLYCWAGAGIGDVAALGAGTVTAGPLEQGLFWLGLAATFIAVWYLERLAKAALRDVDEATLRDVDKGIAANDGFG